MWILHPFFLVPSVVLPLVAMCDLGVSEHSDLRESVFAGEAGDENRQQSHDQFNRNHNKLSYHTE